MSSHCLALAAVATLVALGAVELEPRVSAQPASTVRATEFHGRRAWVLQNGTIRVTLIATGGHIAEVRLLAPDSPGINPMYLPPAAGYMGHLVCFPHYGPASRDERQHGLSGHGEAGSAEWNQLRPPVIDAHSLTFSYGADLPKTGYRIARVITLRTGSPLVHVAESVENLAPYDRPYNWNQHATFGAPFVASGRNLLDVSATMALTDARRTGGGQWSPSAEFSWPDAPGADGASLNLREFRAQPSGQVYTVLQTAPSPEKAWFTLTNADHGLLVGYVFSAADHPWIIDWQNRPEADSTARTARGIQFGTSPFDEGLRASVERGRLFGIPTYRWIGAGQRLSTAFTIFLTAVPSNFAGVEAVTTSADRIVVRERGAARELVLAGGEPR
jgi:hypothetical protein